MQQPPQQGTDERTLVMLMWGLTIFFGLAPVIFFAIAQPHQTQLKRQSAMGITLLIVMVVGGIIGSVLLLAFGLGVLVFLGLYLFHLILCIQGLIAANNNQDFQPSPIADWTRSIFKI